MTARTWTSWSWWRTALFGERSKTPPAAPQPPAAFNVPLEGAQRGWLRVLPAAELLATLKAHDAMEAIWRQSRLSQDTWRRDLQPAIERMAELVQLMPASEAHHHAHVGGLLAHTLEMTLAALTWRNGRLLPEGATIEQIDRERDQWTYAVFFASLLHDIAKPMTDLCITWRATGMPQPLQWTPISGSLVQVSQGWKGAEYRVDFTPKSQRDYGAHSRLALTLFPMIAPENARALLSRTPGALQALVKYLGGQDKASLLARTVIDADRRSVANALRRGSRARFETAASELLMQALRDLLKSGALPLNRDGAAGWVYEGCLWLVAKRAADSARSWVKEHAPEESIPGESKNDRLFDTWQEYGCIRLNPQSGQAIWYVRVHGTAPDSHDGGEPVYCHELSVLCFALDKLYDDASQYPPDMYGRIEVLAKRAARANTTLQEAETEEPAAPNTPPWDGNAADGIPQGQQKPEIEAEKLLDEDEAASSVAAPSRREGMQQASKKPPKKRWHTKENEKEDGSAANLVRAPTFHRPVPKQSQPLHAVPEPSAVSVPEAVPEEGKPTPTPVPTIPAPIPAPPAEHGSDIEDEEPGELEEGIVIAIGASTDGFDDGFDAESGQDTDTAYESVAEEDGDAAPEFLDDEDSARSAASQSRQVRKKGAALPLLPPARQPSKPASKTHPARKAMENTESSTHAKDSALKVPSLAVPRQKTPPTKAAPHNAQLSASSSKSAATQPAAKTRVRRMFAQAPNPACRPSRSADGRTSRRAE